MKIDNRVDCEFCDELAGGFSNSFRLIVPQMELPSRIIHQSRNFVALPSLGGFCPGLVLILPKYHVYSMGQIHVNHTYELRQFIAEIRDAVEIVFGSKTIIFEHGATSNSHKGGACLDHAHLHLCPLGIDFEPLALNSNLGAHHLLQNISELRFLGEEDKPYLYYENPDGYASVIELHEKAPSQYFRRILAKALSVPGQWDWALFPHINHLLVTYHALIQQLNSTGNYYNQFHTDYFENTKSLEHFKKLKNDVDYFMELMDGSLVLDAGTGSCRDASYLCQHGFQVEAIDLSEKLLSMSGEILHGVGKRVMDVRFLGYKDQSFDGIWCNAVILHFGQWQLRLIIEEFRRVLKEGGLLHFSLKAESETSLGRYYYSRDKAGRLFTYYNQEYLKNILLNLGFTFKHERTIVEKDSLGVPTEWLKYYAIKNYRGNEL